VISGTPADISTSTVDANGAVVAFVLPTAIDTTNLTVHVICTPASGSLFTIGTTTVVCTASDTNGTASTTFDIAVAQTSSSGGSSTPSLVVVNNGVGSYSSGGSSSSGGGFANPFLLTSTTSPVVINSCPLLTSYLQFGKANDASQVTKLQAFLTESQGLNVNVNGTFDLQTENAVRAFQSKYLAQVMGPWGATQPSGYVYITTEKKINELACNTTLTLDPSEMAIINAYKSQQNQNSGASTVGTTAGATVAAPSVGTSTATTTTLAPVVGQNGVGAAANTAAAINSSGFQRFWNFVKSLF